MIIKLLILIMLIILESVSFAYRPFTTEDAGVAGKGVVQFEASWDYFKWENNDRENNFLFVPIYGVTERFELSFEIPYLFHGPKAAGDQSGLGDINMVGKYLIWEERGLAPAFTLKSVIKADTGSKENGLGSGDRDYSFVAVASKTWGKIFLHSMLGYTFAGKSGNANLRDVPLYGLAMDFGLSEKFHLVTEVSGNRHPDQTVAADPLSFLLGITYNISDKVIGDAALKLGLNNSAPNWNLAIGSSISF